MAKKVPLKLEDGTVIGTATIHDNGSIDAEIIDKLNPVAKKFREQLSKGLIKGLSYDPVGAQAMPIFKGDEWKKDLLELTDGRSSRGTDRS